MERELQCQHKRQGWSGLAEKQEDGLGYNNELLLKHASWYNILHYCLSKFGSTVLLLYTTGQIVMFFCPANGPLPANMRSHMIHARDHRHCFFCIGYKQ